ncbi:endoglucanase A [Patella vulgata]|uniref:endoglucanase A n=1 Tax=Patella vulgata TaxID=6465 RepID=UPI00218009E1|nr:endoglucanase A [Patella vulgata]
MLLLAISWLVILGSHAQHHKIFHMTGVQDWTGKFQGEFNIPFTEHVDGWEMIITFSVPVTGFSEWMGDVVKTSTDNRVYTIVDKPHVGIQEIGNKLQVTVSGSYSGSKPPTATAEFINLGKDDFKPTELPNKDHTKYNYDQVLELSILFYETQRSGKLPANNRIPWRGDSALGDKGQNGEDLTGGWYDAGDHVKFGLPMAYSTTILTWSLLEFKDAYTSSGQLQYMYDCIKWPLDYFLKAHTKANELYIQVGDGGKDHSYWGRPEDMKMDRPSYKLDASCPGSDVAAETAAAFAAGYMVFKTKDPAYANKLLKHSRELYAFALAHQGIYTDCVNEAAAYYRSMGFEDELAWGGAWLYYATKEDKYLTSAEKYHQPGKAWGMSWDDKQAAETVLLYKLTKKDKYKQDIEATYTDWMPGGGIPYTPKGLAYRLKWGALRYASNMAFIALMAAEEGLHETAYRKWAQGQIYYALGDTGRSFLIGYGTNYPRRPHHRGSSCPQRPAPCAWFDQTQPGPNPHILYGALVGGPDEHDGYSDKRDDYVHNEVATDYNAAFQAAVACLKSLHLRGKFT